MKDEIVSMIQHRPDNLMGGMMDFFRSMAYGFLVLVNNFVNAINVVFDNVLSFNLLENITSSALYQNIFIASIPLTITVFSFSYFISVGSSEKIKNALTAFFVSLLLLITIPSISNEINKATGKINTELSKGTNDNTKNILSEYVFDVKESINASKPVKVSDEYDVQYFNYNAHSKEAPLDKFYPQKKKNANGKMEWEEQKLETSWLFGDASIYEYYVSFLTLAPILLITAITYIFLTFKVSYNVSTIAAHTFTSPIVIGASGSTKRIKSVVIQVAVLYGTVLMINLARQMSIYTSSIIMNGNLGVIEKIFLLAGASAAILASCEILTRYFGGDYGVKSTPRQMKSLASSGMKAIAATSIIKSLLGNKGGGSSSGGKQSSADNTGTGKGGIGDALKQGASGMKNAASKIGDKVSKGGNNSSAKQKNNQVMGSLSNNSQDPVDMGIPKNINQQIADLDNRIFTEQSSGSFAETQRLTKERDELKASKSNAPTYLQQTNERFKR